MRLLIAFLLTIALMISLGLTMLVRLSGEYTPIPAQEKAAATVHLRSPNTPDETKAPVMASQTQRPAAAQPPHTGWASILLLISATLQAFSVALLFLKQDRRPILFSTGLALALSVVVASLGFSPLIFAIAIALLAAAVLLSMRVPHA